MNNNVTGWFPKIVERFDDCLVRWVPAHLDGISLPELSKEFLLNVGLPNLSRWTVQFAPPPDARGLHVPAGDMLGLRQIGVDFRYPICLDLKSDGRVVEIDPRKGKIRLINSRVEYFGVFILLHQLTIDQGKNSDAGTRRRLTVSLEESMIAIDAVALADGDWFWATFLEEMKLMS